MATEIHNTSIEPLPLPYPFRGILKGLGSIVVDMTEAEVVTALAGSGGTVKGVRLVTVPDPTSYDTFETGGAAGGASSPATVFVGNLTGNVTGNLTGNSAGVHTGAVTGDVTGNVTGNSAGTHTGSVAGTGATSVATGTGGVTTTGPVALTNAAAASKTIGVDATAVAVGLAGAALAVQAGPGGVADASNVGGASGAVAISSRTGAAGSAAQAAGASGAASLVTGAGGADGGGGGAASGNARMDCGAATGAATAGVCQVGDTGAERVELGRTGKRTDVQGILRAKADIQIDLGIDAVAGVTATIDNKAAGKFVLAIGGPTFTLISNLITANSLVHMWCIGGAVAASVFSVVAGAGSAVLTLSGNAGAEATFAFLIINPGA